MLFFPFFQKTGKKSTMIPSALDLEMTRTGFLASAKADSSTHLNSFIVAGPWAVRVVSHHPIGDVRIAGMVIRRWWLWSPFKTTLLFRSRNTEVQGVIVDITRLRSMAWVLTQRNFCSTIFLLHFPFPLSKSSESGMAETWLIVASPITAVRHVLMFMHGTLEIGLITVRLFKHFDEITSAMGNITRWLKRRFSMLV